MDDDILLASGDHTRLIAKYEIVIVQRCVAALHGSLDAEDVAQDVKLRLWRELQAGKRYEGIPYRVVVHQVITWTIKEHWQGRDTHAPLPEGWEPDPEPDFSAEVDSRDWMESVLADLPEGMRRVAEARFLRGLEPDEIMAETGMSRQAVDTALHRAREKLRATLLAGG